MNSTLKTLTTVAAGSIAAMSFASGATAQSMIMFDQDIPESGAPFPAPFEFTLPGFDEALGMLTGVTITTTVNTVGEVDIFNGTDEDQNFTNATSSVTLNVASPSGLIATTAVSTVADGVVVPGLNIFPGEPETQVSETIVDMADFGLYTNGGVDLMFAANAPDGIFSGSSVPGVFFSGSAVVGGNVKITYTFTTETTPEPGTIVGLLAVGAAGLASRRRKS